MIQSIGQVMLYVDDVERALHFWVDKAAFEYQEAIEAQGYTAYAVAPKKDSEVQFVLQDKKVVAELSPELNLATPSILMTTQDLQATYDTFIKNGVQANPIIDMGFMKVFNFCDEEGNYFAIREQQ